MKRALGRAPVAWIALAACSPPPATPVAPVPALSSSAPAKVPPPLVIEPVVRRLFVPLDEPRRSPDGAAEGFTALSAPDGRVGAVVLGKKPVFVDGAAWVGWAGPKHAVASGGTGVAVIDLERDRVVTFPVSGAPPVVAPGRLLFSDGAGALHLVDVVRGVEIATAVPGGASVASHVLGDGRFAVVTPRGVTVYSPTLEKVHDAPASALTVFDDGSAGVMVLGARSRIRLFEAGRMIESPPFGPPLAGETEGALKRHGAAVFVPTMAGIARWEPAKKTVRTLVKTGPTPTFEPTADGAHLCVDGIDAPVDATTGVPRRDGVRCVLRAQGGGRATIETLDFGELARSLAPVSRRRPMWGIVTEDAVAASVSGAMVFLAPSSLHVVHTVSAPLPGWFEPGGRHSVIGTGAVSSVLETRAPFRRADIADHASAAHLGEGTMHDADGAIDLETAARRPGREPTLAFERQNGRLALVGAHVWDLETGAVRRVDGRRCQREIASDGRVVDVRCEQGEVTTTGIDGQTRSFPREHVSWARPTTRGRTLVVGEHGGHAVIGATTEGLLGDLPVLRAGGVTLLVPANGDVAETEREIRAPPKKLFAAAPTSGLLVVEHAVRTLDGAVTIELPEPAHAAAFSPDEARVLVVGARRARVWDVRTGAIVASFEPAPRWVDRAGLGETLAFVGNRLGLEAVSLVDGRATSFVVEARGRLVTLGPRGAVDHQGASLPELASRIVCSKRGDVGAFVPCE